MYVYRTKIFCTALLLLISSTLKSQTVGVVLSGGGAKALAHIGFLQLLEEKKIKIDAIGGSSMGALLAALYASGYSVAEIKTIFIDPDLAWDRGDFKKYYHYNGYNFEKNNSSFLNFNVPNFSSVSNFLPNNFIASEPLSLGLISYLATQKNEFDSLFAKFRCYAVEINSHSKYTFKKGNMIKAILASMAYPFYLPPQQIDMLTFLDGGIYDNFPVESIDKEFHPTFILGSQISLIAEEKTDNNSLNGLIRLIKKQEVPYLYSFDSTHKIAIVKHENIARKYSTFNFTNPDFIIETGYRNSKKNWDTLLSKYHLPIDTALKKRRIHYTHNIKPLIFSDFIIKSGTKKQKRYIESLVRPKNKRIWQLPAFEKRFSKLFYDPRFRNFSFEYTTDSTDNDYKILSIENYQFLPHSLNSGGGIMGGENGGIYNLYISYGYSYFALRTLMQTKISLKLSNFNNEASLEHRIDIPQLFHNFLTFRGDIQDNNYYNWKSTFSGLINLNFLISRSYEWTAKWNIPIARKIILSVGGRYQRIRMDYYKSGNIRTDRNSTDNTSISNISLFSDIIYNTLNHKQYPSSGMLFYVKSAFNNTRENYHYEPSIQNNENIIRFSKNKYYIIQTHLEKYTKIFDNLTIGFSLGGVFSNIQLQRDYYTSLAIMPRFMPILELNYLFEDRYFSPSFINGGIKFIVIPFRKIENIFLRVESYFLYKKFNLAKNAQNNIMQFEHKDKWKISLDIIKQPIISSSLIWNNKYLPVGITVNYYPDNILQISKDLKQSGKLHLYFTLGYIINYKKISIYQP